MRQVIVEKLVDRFAAYSELAATVDDDLLSQKIDVPKHKSLAEHLWCVVGARESYARAIEAGAWAGFSCSMEAFSASDFAEKLEESGAAVEQAIRSVSDWSDERSALLATLAEHEVMHEGQIIRHMYALEKELPASWVWA
ncbi:MAG: hypothetical protein AAGE43_01520 [Pseudomonadota bacterium]